MVLASKVTPTWPTRDRVAAAARGSLARLGTGHLDLYQVHWPNPLVAQRSTMAGMRTLQAGGLVRQVGVSNYSLGRWKAAEAALGGPVVSNQVRYSLLTRKPERKLLPHAAAAGRLIVAYSPLAQGVLAAKAQGWSERSCSAGSGKGLGSEAGPDPGDGGAVSARMRP